MKPNAYLTIVNIAVSTIACGDTDRTAAMEGFDGFLDSIATEYSIPGYAFAAFDDRGIIYQHVAGYKNLDTKEAVDSQTVFEAASISKPVFAYIALALARAGTLPLDSPLGYAGPVERELGYDLRSDVLTPRMLLAHQGGLPNWRSRMRFEATRYEEMFPATDTLRFVEDPGIGYRYSGEGYVLLQQVVEEVTQRGLNDLAGEFVFEPLDMTRSSFSFDTSLRSNAAWGHDRSGRPDKWEIGLALASSTLHTTATDLAQFGVHLVSGIQQKEHYAIMAVPEASVGSRDEWHGSWGLGLGIITDGTNRYLYHGGNNVIFLADFIYGFEENLGYVLLTNSALGGAMIEQLEVKVFGKDLPR